MVSLRVRAGFWVMMSCSYSPCLEFRDWGLEIIDLDIFSMQMTQEKAVKNNTLPVFRGFYPFFLPSPKKKKKRSINSQAVAKIVQSTLHLIFPFVLCNYSRVRFLSLESFLIILITVEFTFELS